MTSSNEQKSTSAISKREQLRIFYSTINQVAKPGDVVFFISEKPYPVRSKLSRIYRKWQGLADSDTTVWHTAILVNPKKESRGAQWRPRIVHATTKGVEEIHIPPSYFTNVRDDPAGEATQKGCIEIIQSPQITDHQRHEIVRYAKAQLGKSFAEFGWPHDILTYALGLPARKLAPGKVSCHGLAFFAYKNIGFSFPHQLGNAPFFNLAKYIGYPLGHPPHEVDLNRLYLRDHHLYRDPRFESILAISEDEETKQITVTQNPGKHL